MGNVLLLTQMILEVNINKAERMKRSEAARTRRKHIKDIVFTRTINFYNKMRKLRKLGKNK